MKSFRVTSLFILAVILSLSVSKRFASAASEKDELKMKMFANEGRPAVVNLEHELLEKLDPLGRVVGAFKPNAKLATDDTIYIKLHNAQVSVGDKFLIYNDLGGIKMPGSFFKKVGHNILYKGVIQITSVLPETVVAKIIESWLDIEMNDSLTTYRDLQVTINPKEPVVEKYGHILGSPKGLELIGPFELAYIDLGSRDGLRKDDRLFAFMTGDGRREIVKGLPEVNTAEMVIVSLGEKFSTVYVLSANDRMESGNAIKTAIPLVKFLDDQPAK